MLLNNKGLSLVEMMVAMVILLLVFLALMQTALVSIDSNMRNLLRDEAVTIAEQRMTALRNLPSANAGLTDTNGASNSLGNFVADSTVQRNLRNILQLPFTVTRRVDDVNIDTKQLEITVAWNWKGETFSHQIASLKRRE